MDKVNFFYTEDARLIPPVYEGAPRVFPVINGTRLVYSSCVKKELQKFLCKEMTYKEFIKIKKGE